MFQLSFHMIFNAVSLVVHFGNVKKDSCSFILLIRKTEKESGSRIFMEGT